MYYIEQTCENETSIVGKATNEKHFFGKIINYMRVNYSSYQLLKSITLDTLKSCAKYEEGTYLLVNDKCLQLVIKTKSITKGYIYNSVNLDTKILYTWTLIKTGDMIPVKNNEISINPNIYNVLPFPKNKLHDSKLIIISGKTGTGIYTLVRSIIPKLNKTEDSEFNKNILVVSPSERITGYYSINFPGCKAICEINYDSIKQHIDEKKGCIIFDDCYNTKNIYDLPEYILTPQIPIVFVCQSHQVWIESELNIYVDYIFNKNEIYKFKIKNLWENYRNYIPDFDIFERIFNNYTRGHGTFVIDNKATDAKFYWYNDN